MHWLSITSIMPINRPKEITLRGSLTHNLITQNCVTTAELSSSSFSHPHSGTEHTASDALVSFGSLAEIPLVCK